MTQNSKSNTGLTQDFLELSFAILTPKVWIIHENTIIILFFSENEHFILPSSSFSSIYNIFIAINTLTTMKNQFVTLNAPKNQFSLFLSHFLCTKTTFLSLSLIIHPKKLQDFDSKLFKVHRVIQA